MHPRRDGDIAQCWANPQKSLQELGWQARYPLATMLEDAWRWQCSAKGAGSVRQVS